MAFYRVLAEEVKGAGGSVLEIACGTGRVTIRLARVGVNITGLDRSTEMLAVARQKSAALKNLRWVKGDMRSFELDETFDLVLIPGHSFQNLNTPDDQASCLACIRKHLKPGGRLVLHLDHMNRENMRWLGDLCGGQGGVFEAEEEFKHPETGIKVRALRAWNYEPGTQTAIVQSVWEELDDKGGITRRVERESIRLHTVFRFEMEHLLARTGYEIEAIYGDFLLHELQDDSPGMIWVASRP